MCWEQTLPLLLGLGEQDAEMGGSGRSPELCPLSASHWLSQGCPSWAHLPPAPGLPCCSRPLKLLLLTKEPGRLCCSHFDQTKSAFPKTEAPSLISRQPAVRAGRDVMEQMKEQAEPTELPITAMRMKENPQVLPFTATDEAGCSPGTSVPRRSPACAVWISPSGRKT